jgi:translation initiation factor 4E
MDSTWYAPLTAAVDQATPYPLERAWDVWASFGQKFPNRTGRRRGALPSRAPIELVNLGGFATVQDFWCWHNNLPAPSTLPIDGNLFLFQRGIDPAWEDPANVNGGRWVASAAVVPDEAWLGLCMALVGEHLDPGAEVTGLVLSRRRDYGRVSVWTREKTKEAEVMLVGRRLRELLGAKSAELEYQDHGVGYGAACRYKLKS